MFCDRALRQGILPDAGLIGGMIVLFLLSLLEWPLVCLISVILDEMTGGGEEGNRAFLLYPVTQLPRLLPLAGALIMVLLGVPILPVLFWIGAIGWSFLLASALTVSGDLWNLFYFNYGRMQSLQLLKVKLAEVHDPDSIGLRTLCEVLGVAVGIYLAWALCSGDWRRRLRR